jgi:hypothetical protein
MCEKAGCDAIELVGAVDENSPVVGFLKKSERNWLPYHLCFAVSSIDGFLADLKAAGIPCPMAKKKSPAVLFGGLTVCFVYIKGMGLTELVETDATPVAKENTNTVMLATKEPERARAFLKHIGYGNDLASPYSGRIVIDACEDEDSEAFGFYKLFGSCVYSIAF